MATTGIAGPGGGTKEKPVGLVYVACADKDGVTVERLQLGGDRARVRRRDAQGAGYGAPRGGEKIL